MDNLKHYMGVEKSQRFTCYCWCVVFLVITTILSDTYGQTVRVTMENVESNVTTNTATMVCEFGINDDNYAFRNLVWKKGSTTLAHFYGGAADPTYLDYCSPLGLCTITRDSSSSQFVLSPVDFDRDNGNDYECQATYNKDATTVADKATAALTVVKPASTMVMSNGSSSVAFTDGEKVELSRDVDNHIFQCVVAGINPQATFTWTVGSKQLSSDSITENHVVDSGTGLTTSTSIATLTPDPTYNAQDLICKAVNYEGDPGVMFRLVLKVADPCVGVECKNGGTCVIDPNDPSMPKCECPDGYEGNLCRTELIGLSTGAKIGIGVGCACGCVIAAGCGIAIYKYNKTTEVTPEGQSKEGQSKKGQSKKGKKKDADGKTPENV